ncbi:Predicted oxidoreductase, contains short-chain dehydrogenase (SDR) and DUF2520 domains [Flavobacterium fluvii]|uniref:Predicted oxidoreductase, contains short-chain dehydrogenase (SDR) and DUF2520 domains n=1 Tax=Flavobacterium fluvii TaxID=468056 RepID=A0A1M5N697_9FLAO|nr:Rossmann-like and DUF2520 domain-containing protein [Flavobacterium fluvii]SHG85084.1 Predicted oxidoreductase, contains short-chain dehydrogenase (SDR) and DUF2520 domains [Flavobacterium fluvii]
MIKVIIIGSGNVAQHLIKAFDKNKKIEVVQVFSRQKEAVAHLLDSPKITDNFNDLKDADLYVIAVSDDAIAAVSSQLPFENRLVVHTSGSVSLEALDKKNRNGIFYPLQTFSKKAEVDFSKIPICLESEKETDFEFLKKVAELISQKVYKINSGQRKSLHVAAVFVNNFVNQLYQMGNEICIENDVPFDVLKPLIQETANKVMTLSPKDAQTGPAIRNDQKTIAAHLDFLKDENQKNIYKILTQSIQNNGKKL